MTPPYTRLWIFVPGSVTSFFFFTYFEMNVRFPTILVLINIETIPKRHKYGGSAEPPMQETHTERTIRIPDRDISVILQQTV